MKIARVAADSVPWGRRMKNTRSKYAAIIHELENAPKGQALRVLFGSNREARKAYSAVAFGIRRRQQNHTIRGRILKDVVYLEMVPRAKRH